MSVVEIHRNGTVGGRFYVPEDNHDREACLQSPPAFLVGQRVRVNPDFCNRKPFEGEITSIHLRTINWPRWQYTVTGGGTENIFGTECEKHFEQGELHALDDEGPCGDGNLEYEDLVKAVCRRDASKIANNAAGEAIDLFNRLCELIPDCNEAVSNVLDELWAKLCDIRSETVLLADDLDYRTPVPPQEPNVFMIVKGREYPLGHATETTITAEAEDLHDAFVEAFEDLGSDEVVRYRTPGFFGWVKFQIGDLVSRGCGDTHRVIAISEPECGQMIEVECVMASDGFYEGTYKVGEREHNLARRYSLISGKVIDMPYPEVEPPVSLLDVFKKAVEEFNEERDGKPS